jgi:DNA-binding CsgD family transcriptional regulator
MEPTLEELSRTLASIHEAAASPERWTNTLAALTRLCESSKAALLDVDAAGRFQGFSQIGHDPAAQKEYAEHYHAVDPTLQIALSGRPHEALVTYEHFPAAVRARSEYFAFMGRYDVGDVIGVRTHGEPAGSRTILSLQRPMRAHRFGEETKRLLALIAPHLELAKRVQARVAKAIASRDVLSAGLDRLADAAFILDATRTIRFANAAARQQLAVDARLRSGGGRLAMAVSRLDSAFHKAVQSAAAKAVRSQVLALPAAAGCVAAEVVVSPLLPAHPLASAWQEPLVLVMITSTRLDGSSIAARMRQLYGLTPAEAGLVARLALGRTIEEICILTGIRESTLRTQVKSIFAKVGVARQADLVRVALSGARITADPHT